MGMAPQLLPARATGIVVLHVSLSRQSESGEMPPHCMMRLVLFESSYTERSSPGVFSQRTSTGRRVNQAVALHKAVGPINPCGHSLGVRPLNIERTVLSSGRIRADHGAKCTGKAFRIL
jgi:hypothetical protein